MLSALITRYHAAKRVWEAQFEADEDLACESPEWDTYQVLTEDIIAFPAANQGELTVKAALILSDPNMFDCVNRSNGGKQLRILLASLCGAGHTVRLAIEDHRRALSAWKEAAKPDEDLPADGAVWDRYADAEFHFIALQCFRPNEVQLKLAYVESCREIAAAIKEYANGDGESYQTIFLRSITLPSAVDKSNIGEK